MNLSNKIALLEIRLHRLESRDRDNEGVCRRIRREIRNLKALASAQAERPPEP